MKNDKKEKPGIFEKEAMVMWVPVLILIILAIILAPYILKMIK